MHSKPFIPFYRLEIKKKKGFTFCKVKPFKMAGDKRHRSYLVSLFFSSNMGGLSREA
jgi:hypothetical protein